MKLRNVSYKKRFLFFKPTLTIASDEGEASIFYDQQPDLEELNNLIRDFSITIPEDFTTLTTTIQDKKLARCLQLVAFNSLRRPFTFFHQQPTSLPKPMHVLLKKPNGIEFLSLSLDATNFDKAALANEQLYEAAKNIKDLASKTEEAILQELTTSLNNISLHFDFTLRLGINFAGQVPTQETEHLIQTHNLLYAEQPCQTPEDYKQLTEKFKQTTFICSPSPASPSNAALLSFTTIQDLATTCSKLKEQKINIFYELAKGEEHLAVSLGIPIVKIQPEQQATVRALSKIKTLLKETMQSRENNL